MMDKQKGSNADKGGDMAIIFTPMGYHTVGFKDCIIGLPIFEPYYRPRIYKKTTKRWSYIKVKDKWANKRLKQAIRATTEAMPRNGE